MVEQIPLWTLIAFYAAARVLQLFPDKIPMLVIVASHVFPPAIFTLIHGAIRYRARGILAALVKIKRRHNAGIR